MKSPLPYYQSLPFAFLLIAALGLIAYSASFAGDFVYDDWDLVGDNIHLRSWCNLPSFFLEHPHIGSSFARDKYYRPLRTLSYMLDYHLWQHQPWGYHITNLLWHILTGCALYYFLRRLLGTSSSALLTSCIYMVHPIHVEAVAYISGRTDPMFFFFLLVAFIFYLHAIRAPVSWNHRLLGLSYTAALLSKEHAIMLIPLIALYHWVFNEKIKWRTFSVLIGVTAGYLIWKIAVIGAALPYFTSTRMFPQRIISGFIAIPNYIRILVAPFHLYLNYDYGTVFALTDIRAVCGLMIIIIMAIIVFRGRKSAQSEVFACGWFLIMIVPVIGLVPIDCYMADHYLYAPSVGLILLGVLGLQRLMARARFKQVRFMVPVIIIAFLSVRTIQQCAYWCDDITFYTRSLRYIPEAAFLYNNMGQAYYRLGNDDKALEWYNKALSQHEHYPGVHYNKALIYERRGEIDRAKAAYIVAIYQAPRYAAAYKNLANLYASQHDAQQAAVLYEESIALNPDDPDSYFNYGILLSRCGYFEKALAQYQQAINLNPIDAETYYRISVVLTHLDRHDEAARQRAKAEKYGYLSTRSLL